MSANFPLIPVDPACIPAGYKPVRFGIPAVGEPYVNMHKSSIASRCEEDDTPWQAARVILEKIETWRPATPADAIAGKQCRCRDHNHRAWTLHELCGYNARSIYPWIVASGPTSYDRYTDCEVRE